MALGPAPSVVQAAAASTAPGGRPEITARATLLPGYAVACGPVLWGVQASDQPLRLIRFRHLAIPANSTMPAPRAEVVPVPANLSVTAASAWREVPILEQEHVVNVYETIAGHWDQTRHTPWPRVAGFLEALPTGALVADVGCGNGKYLGTALGRISMLGSDRCVNLVEICRRQGFEVAVADNMALPYRSGLFDAVISIAVLHHFSTAARRLRALTELARLLRPGGKLLVQAWALEQVNVLDKDHRDARDACD